jgi:DNA processing protein
MQDGSHNLASWLRLERTTGIGPDAGRRLLSAFGLPENIFRADFSALRHIVPERAATALLAPLSDDDRRQLDQTLAWAEQAGNRVLTLADADYPQYLLEISDPPLLVYAKGRAELLERTSIAVVGSRNASTQGASDAERFSAALAGAGLNVVSGLALGIDAAAHRGGLSAACSPHAGSTIAVIGTGIDIVYPARNRELAHRIAEQGCLLSEYPLGTPAIAANFPRRNRLISGLSRGVLVVEAAAQSGSLITARLAAEQGREVFALPGSIHSPLSKGCHLLIKQGAKLVESVDDILEELGMAGIGSHTMRAASVQSGAHGLNEHADKLLELMGHSPVDADTLCARAGLDAASLNAQLLTLELSGKIELLPGGIYRRLC